MDLLFEPTERKLCPICGSAGEVIYSGLHDMLYHSPGEWDFRACANQACDLIWLDPIPQPDDLVRAYRDYYTHHAPTESRAARDNLVDGWISKNYLARRFGYPFPSYWLLNTLAAGITKLLPRMRANLNHRVGHLPYEAGGHLLEIGCGNGDFIQAMQDLGWTATGVEMDERAASVAKGRGLNVFNGVIENLSLPENMYSAIVMNHVVEHLASPLETLSRCCDLLRPTGQLILTTPNPSGIGHRLFRGAWRGLEPPRHMQLFGPKSAEACIERCGLEITEMRPTLHWADGILRQSMLLAFPALRSNLFGKALAVAAGGGIAQLEATLVAIGYSFGEEWLIKARKAG